MNDAYACVKVNPIPTPAPQGAVSISEKAVYIYNSIHEIINGIEVIEQKLGIGQGGIDMKILKIIFCRHKFQYSLLKVNDCFTSGYICHKCGKVKR